MRLARSLVALGTLVSLAATCTDPVPTAIIDRPSFIVNGAPPGGQYSSAGALLFDWWEPLGVLNGDDQSCTGSLISPTVFVTAAHCVVGPDMPPGTQFYVSFAPDLLGKHVKVIKATGYAFDPL